MCDGLLARELPVTSRHDDVRLLGASANDRGVS